MSVAVTLSPSSTVRSLPRQTVLHKVLQYESFPRAAALHELPQHGSLPWDAALQEQPAAVRVPHGVTSPARKPALVWAPLSIGPQVLAGACSSVGSPWGHSLLHHSLLHRLQGNLCSGAWRTSSPTFSAWLFLSCSHSTLPAAVAQQLLPFLKHVISEALPPSLMGSALASSESILVAGQNWLYRAWGKLLASSHTSHLHSPHTIKTLPGKLSTVSQVRRTSIANVAEPETGCHGTTPPDLAHTSLAKEINDKVS